MKNEYRFKINTTYSMFCPQFRKVKSFIGIKIKGRWMNIMLSVGQATGVLTCKEGSPHEYDEWYYSEEMAQQMIISHSNPNRHLTDKNGYSYLPLK